MLHLAWMALAALTQAAEDELYAPAPPPDAAFVRLVNASETPVQGQVAGLELEAGPTGASAYRVVKAGEHSSKAGTAQAPLTYRAGAFYSLVYWSPKGSPELLPLEDMAATNLAKALVVLYNLTDLPAITLKTADGQANVIESVASGAYGTREVNAVEVAFSVAAQDKVLGSTEKTALRRGAVYNVLVSGTEAAPSVAIVPSRTVTE